MAISFKLIQFPFLSLAFVIGSDQSIAEKSMNEFLDSNGIIEPRRFHFEMVVSKSGEKHVTHFVYAPVPTNTQAKEPVKITNLIRDTFIQFSLSEQEYDDLLNNKGVQNELNDFIKNAGLKADFSSVFALVEVVDNKQIVYIPYKTK